MAHSGFEELYRSKEWYLSAGPMKHLSKQNKKDENPVLTEGKPCFDRCFKKDDKKDDKKHKHNTMEHFLFLALQQTLKLIHGKVSIVFTGHSLGGACASLMAFDTSYQLQTHVCSQEECNRSKEECACERMVDGEHKIDGKVLKKLQDLETPENTCGVMSPADRVSKHVKCYTFGQPMAFCIPYLSKSQSINSMLPGSRA
jgi:hypothetical protein